MERSLRFDQVFWLGVIALFALFVGFNLASNPFLLVFSIVFAVWLVLIPYHAKLAIYLSVATFSSALILPYFPGRPYLWEFAALLAWSGLIITISLRRYAPDTKHYIRKYRWLFVAIACYCVVLIITMSERGFGLRIMGTDQQGGRFYFQQLMCSIFPLLFVLVRMPERTLIKLYVLQCLLTFSFLVSDFALSWAGGLWSNVLQFFELSGDATNFEMQAQRFGIRRFQSLSYIGLGLMLLILLYYKLEDFFSGKALYLVPLAGAVFGVGLLSGHRFLSLILMITCLFLGWTQRFYNLQNILKTSMATIIVLIPLILYAEYLPLSAQRALSYIPGIRIENVARANGEATLNTRRLLRIEGWKMIPEYFWIGRGFTMPTRDYSHIYDPTYITMHVNQGRFYNGFIGLMVNTSVFGTLFMLIFLAAGSYLAFAIMKILRRHGCDDLFTRLCCIVSSLWMANVIAFLFFHGDSEFAMKTFSLQAGLMIACKRSLDYRYSDLPQTLEEPDWKAPDYSRPPLNP